MPPRHTRAPAALPRGPIAPVHRGPQAAAFSAAGVTPFHAPNAALLIDFDNVTMGVRSDLGVELRNLLSSDIVKGKVSVQRAYADWRRYPQYIVPLSESSIDLIFAPAYGSSKKNATDIRLAIDALELVFTRPEIGTFILLSGDSDFSSLVIKLKEYAKYVIGVGIRESSSDLLVQNCDEYYSYNHLAGLVSTREEDVQKWDPWELAGEAVQRMKQNGDVMRADRLKQVMQQIDSSFDEKNLGMAKFSRFVLEASQRGILSLQKMENGQYEVDLPRAAGTTHAIAPAAATPALETAEPGTGERRSRRGGRGGRGRGERQRAAHPDGTVPAAPEEARAQPTPAAPPEIGASGMRLTREEAFDLVRRAVARIATGDAAASVNDVRRSARDLLARDSESLSERNFTRILQDAQSSGVVELRRHGDEYQVAPSDQAAVEPVRAPEEATPVAPAPAAVPRGMGPRGVAGRGRAGAAGALPADLLSVGVVDFDLSPAPAARTAVAPPVEHPAPAHAVHHAAPAAAAPTTPRGRKTATKGAKTARKAPAAKSATRKAAAKKTGRKQTS